MPKKIIVPVFLIVLSDSLGWAVILPLLPFYAEKWGASPQRVALLFSAYALAQLVASPVLGWLADRYGRKPILLVSLAGTFLSFVGLALATSFAAILLSRVLDGLTAGNLPIAHACVADATDRQQRPRAFGFLSMAYGVGFLFGPLISALLLHFGYRAPIVLAALFSLVSLALTAVLLPSGKPARVAVPQKLHVRWGLAAILLGLFFIGFNLFTSGFALYAERTYRPGQTSFGAAQLGWLYSYVGAVGILVQGIFFGKILKILGQNGAVALGFLTAVMGFGALSLVSEWPGILAITAVAVFGVAVLRPALTAVLSLAAGSDRQGAVLGFSQSLHGVAQVAAPLATGALIGGGYLTAWTYAISGTMALGLIVQLSCRKQDWC